MKKYIVNSGSMSVNSKQVATVVPDHNLRSTSFQCTTNYEASIIVETVYNCDDTGM